MFTLRRGKLVKLIITIPAYNEENTVSSVLDEIPDQIDGIDNIETLLIDDGSTDGTVDMAQKHGVDHIIYHKTNKGLGVSFRDGIEASLEKGADIIVNIDADGQYNAKQIPDLIKPLLEGKADIVLGWRDIRNLDHMTRSKKLGNRMATWITRVLSGFDVKDAQTGYRAFTRDAAMRLNLFGKYTYVQETIIRAYHKGLHIEQVPVEFRNRPGESRLIRNIWSYAYQAGATILSTYRDLYPLRFFFSVGLIFALAGLGFGIRVLVHFSQTGMVTPRLPSAILAGFLILFSLGSFSLGIFLQMLNTQRRFIEEILYRLKKNGSNGSSIHNP